MSTSTELKATPAPKLTEALRAQAFEAVQLLSLSAATSLAPLYQNKGAYCERKAKAAIAELKSQLCAFERDYASFSFSEDCSGLGNGMDW